MNILKKTWVANSAEVNREWHLIDASNQTVGRIATEIANLLRGKTKPTFTPHVDTGDFVVVVNTDKMILSGSKWQVKKYYRHSRWFGSMKIKTAEQMRGEDSTFVLREAVRGMLPPSKLSRRLILKLKSFKGGEHEHAAQKPQAYILATTKKG